MPSTPSSRRRSVGLAAAVAIALVVWIVSGVGRGLPDQDSPDSLEASPRGETALRVTVRHSEAQPMERKIDVSARTLPSRYVELKAETEGRVIAINVRRGALVRAGEAIAELDMRDRNALLLEARALVRQRDLEFAAADRLHEQGFMSEAELAAAEALLVAARAQEERIALDIARTRITAPFDAVVYDRSVEIGDYISVGDPIAEIVDLDPLLIVGNINERDLGELAIGSPGAASVLGGPEVQGRVHFLSPVADESTRSFRIEIAIPNPDRNIPAGASAKLMLGAEDITAHVISAGLLTLADDGTIGVMVVDAENRARFMAIELAGSTEAGIQAAGLPERIRLITVGQGFVTDGQPVIPVEEAAATSHAHNERAY